MISLFSDWNEYMGGCLYNRHYWRILHIAGGWYLRFLDNNVIRLISVLYLHQLGRHACVRRPEQVEKQLIPHCIARANDCRKLPIFNPERSHDSIQSSQKNMTNMQEKHWKIVSRSDAILFKRENIAHERDNASNASKIFILIAPYGTPYICSLLPEIIIIVDVMAVFYVACYPHRGKAQMACNLILPHEEMQFR